jgi:hypothetical protein
VAWDETKFHEQKKRLDSLKMEKGAEATDVNKDGKVDSEDAAQAGRRCAPAKCIVS